MYNFQHSVSFSAVALREAANVVVKTQPHDKNQLPKNARMLPRALRVCFYCPVSCLGGAVVTRATTWNLSFNKPTSSRFWGWHTTVNATGECCPTLQPLLLNIPLAKITPSLRNDSDVMETVVSVGIYQWNVHISHQVNIHLGTTEHSETLLQ